MQSYKVYDGNGEHVGDFKTNGKIYGHGDNRVLYIYYRYGKADYKPATFSFAQGRITKGCDLPYLRHNIEMQINDLFYHEYR